LDGSFDYVFNLVASNFIKESLMMHMIFDIKCHKDTINLNVAIQEIRVIKHWKKSLKEFTQEEYQ
jgi:hypothetical protein